MHNTNSISLFIILAIRSRKNNFVHLGWYYNTFGNYNNSISLFSLVTHSHRHQSHICSSIIHKCLAKVFSEQLHNIRKSWQNGSFHSHQYQTAYTHCSSSQRDRKDRLCGDFKVTINSAHKTSEICWWELAVVHMLTCKDHTVNNLYLLSVACIVQRFPEHNHKDLVIKNIEFSKGVWYCYCLHNYTLTVDSSFFSTYVAMNDFIVLIKYTFSTLGKSGGKVISHKKALQDFWIFKNHVRPWKVLAKIM